MQVKKIVFLLLVAVSLLCCKKKYPEGGSFSLLSKKARLDNSWVFAEVLTDTSDVTTQVQSNFKNYNIVIDKNGTYTSLYKVNSTDYPDAGKWSFIENDTKVQFNSTLGGGSFVWTILKLKNKDLWVTTTQYTGYKVEVHFVPR